MDEETREHKRRLLAIYQDNLRELELQSAQFGTTPPLFIINQIKGHRKNIDELRLQLDINAEEVSFDKLLIGIEDLQKFVREEGARAVKEYYNIFWDQGLLGFGLFSLLGGGVLIAAVFDWIYQAYVLGISFAGPHDVISAILYIIGFCVGLHFAVKERRSITQSKRDYFAFRMGYDPLDDQNTSRNKRQS